MANFYPKRRIAPGDAVDGDDVNEMFSEIGDVLSGELNEHNFEENAFDTVAQVNAQGLAVYYGRAVSQTSFFNWQPSKIGDDLHRDALNGAYHNVAPGQPALPAEVQIVDPPNVEGLTVQFDIGRTESALLWVMASLQHNQDSWRFGNSNIPSAGSNASDASQPDVHRNVLGMGARYALRLDGTIISETITGAADFTNDAVIERRIQSDIEYEIAYETGSESDHHTIAGSHTYQRAITAPTVMRSRYPVTVDFVLPISPGTHTVDVVVNKVPSPVPVALTNREIIILQLVK